jgi:ribA/ribD-fused uncharacterized protein
MTEPIRGFRGEHAWLSNFHPCSVRVSGVVYPSAEHAYVAMKTDVPEIRAEVALLPKAARAKAFGRNKNFRLREGWDELKLGAMYVAVQSKFHQCPDLAERLLETGDARLEEANDWNDRFWGTVNGDGDNWLGVILQTVRDELRSGASLERGALTAIHAFVATRRPCP